MTWPKDVRHRRVYLHANSGKVFALNIYGHSLQSPLDTTFLTIVKDPQNTRLMKLLIDIDQKGRSQQFRDRRGPTSNSRESKWRATENDRDKMIAVVKSFDSRVPHVGESEDWHWSEAELYVDGRGNYLLCVFYKSRLRGRIWKSVEFDSEAKRIESSGWGEG